MNLLAWVALISCREFEKKLPFYFYSQTQMTIENLALCRKYVVSAETCRDSGQPQVIDSLLEWRVAYSRMSKSRICCRPGLNHSHLPQALPLHSKMWFNLSDVNDTGVTLCYCSILYIRLVTATNTEWGATGVCSCCSTAAYEAHRLRDTSACSATAALIMAETLTVCCLSMLGPHFHSHYLQYPKPLTSLCVDRRRV